MSEIDPDEIHESDTPIEHRPGVAGWDDEPLPARPRRALMTPARGVLLALLLGVAGFLAGVEVEKGQMTPSVSGGRGGRGGGGAAALLAAQGGGGAGGRGLGGGAGGGPDAGGGPGARLGAGGATIGSVSTVHGRNLYVTDLNGNTIRIVADAGAQVSKTVATTATAIHPGDTVVVSGTKRPDGSVTATQIRLSPSGAGGGSQGGLGSLFGGSGSSGSGSSGGGGGGGGGSLRGLFGG